MLKCQRNDESSFAVSASMCIRRKEGEGSRGIGRVRGGWQGGQGIRDRGRDGEREARTCAHTACVCPGAVCHAHSCDLQLMKLGCSRVACQINMSPTSAPLSVVQSLPPAHYLPSSPSSFSTPALPRRFSSPFFVNLPHTTTDVALPPRTLTLSRAALPLPPVPHPFLASGRFDLEQNHRSIRAYMLLTVLSLPSPLHSARR